MGYDPFSPFASEQPQQKKDVWAPPDYSAYWQNADVGTEAFVDAAAQDSQGLAQKVADQVNAENAREDEERSVSQSMGDSLASSYSGKPTTGAKSSQENQQAAMTQSQAQSGFASNQATANQGYQSNNDLYSNGPQGDYDMFKQKPQNNQNPNGGFSLFDRYNINMGGGGGGF